MNTFLECWSSSKFFKLEVEFLKCLIRQLIAAAPAAAMFFEVYFIFRASLVFQTCFRWASTLQALSDFHLLWWDPPISRVLYVAEALYCRSRNLLRKVERPAMTEEKQHCASTSSRKRGLSRRRKNIRGNTDADTNNTHWLHTKHLPDWRTHTATRQQAHSLFRKSSRDTSGFLKSSFMSFSRSIICQSRKRRQGRV